MPPVILLDELVGGESALTTNVPVGSPSKQSLDGLSPTVIGSNVECCVPIPIAAIDFVIPVLHDSVDKSRFSLPCSQAKHALRVHRSARVWQRVDPDMVPIVAIGAETSPQILPIGRAKIQP